MWLGPWNPLVRWEECLTTFDPQGLPLLILVVGTRRRMKQFAVPQYLCRKIIGGKRSRPSHNNSSRSLVFLVTESKDCDLALQISAS